MDCDDCGIETGTDGNHTTDAECMAALLAELLVEREGTRLVIDAARAVDAQWKTTSAQETPEILALRKALDALPKEDA